MIASMTERQIYLLNELLTDIGKILGASAIIESKDAVKGTYLKEVGNLMRYHLTQLRQTLDDGNKLHSPPQASRDP